jgi:hypothetical protein
LVLISRSQQKLTEVAQQLGMKACTITERLDRRCVRHDVHVVVSDFALLTESKHKVQTKTVAVDFTSENPALFDSVKAAIAGLEIGILGMHYCLSCFLCSIVIQLFLVVSLSEQCWCWLRPR